MSKLSQVTKSYVVLIGLCSFMAGVSYVIALVGPWWSNSKDGWSMEMTLWNVHLNGKVDSGGRRRLEEEPSIANLRQKSVAVEEDEDEDEDEGHKEDEEEDDDEDEDHEDEEEEQSDSRRQRRGARRLAETEVKKDIDWHDFCNPDEKYSVKDKEWCDSSRVKIKAARATTIIATIFAFVTLGFLVIGWHQDNPTILSAGGGFCAVLSLMLGVSSIILGTWYPNNSALDTPEWGFVFLCVGAFFSLSSIIIAIFGYICASRLSRGFNTLDEGSNWGSWKPKRKEMPPPALPPPMMPPPMVPIQRPVVAMPQPMPPLPQPAPIGQKSESHFGIAPVGMTVHPNPMPHPRAHEPSGVDFGVGAASIPQPVSMENAAMASGQGRSAAYGNDFGLDRE